MSVLVRAARLPVWRALSIRDFRLLWASEAVSVVGDQFQLVALSWLVISVTGSGLALGTVLIAVAVPRALLLVPLGVVADRRPPRSLMLVAHVVRGGIVAVLAVLASQGAASVPVLAGLGVLFGAADAIYMPAQQAFLPSAVERGRLPSANALLQGTFQLASIVGPPLAGIVIAVAGTGAAFAVDTVSFAIAALLVAGIAGAGATIARRSDTADPAGSAGVPSETFREALLGGVRYVAGDRAIRTLMLVSLVLNLAASGPAAVGMAWLAARRFDAGATGLGLMAAGLAAGAIAGTLLAGGVRLDRQGRTVTAAVVVIGVAMALVGVLGSLPAVVLVLVGIGIAIGYMNIVSISWLQARVAPGLVGRVMSLVMLMSLGISPISIAIAGALIDINATALFVGSGVLILVTAGLGLAVGLPQLMDRPFEPTVPPEPDAAAQPAAVTQ
jgi:Transmembrane secretion effector